MIAQAAWQATTVVGGGALAILGLVATVAALGWVVERVGVVGAIVFVLAFLWLATFALAYAGSR